MMKQKKVHTFNIFILVVNIDRLCHNHCLDYVEDISVFTLGFIINYNKFSDFGYTLIVDINYP